MRYWIVSLVCLLGGPFLLPHAEASSDPRRDPCKEYLIWLIQKGNVVSISESHVGSASVSLSDPIGNASLSFSQIGSLSVSASGQESLWLAVTGVNSASVSLKSVGEAHVSASNVGSLSVSMKNVSHASVSVANAGSVSVSIRNRPKLKVGPGMLVLIPVEEMGNAGPVFVAWRIWDEALVLEKYRSSDLWQFLIRERLVIVRYLELGREIWTLRPLADLSGPYPSNDCTKLEADSLSGLLEKIETSLSCSEGSGI